MWGTALTLLKSKWGKRGLIGAGILVFGTFCFLRGGSWGYDRAETKYKAQMAEALAAQLADFEEQSKQDITDAVAAERRRNRIETDMASIPDDADLCGPDGVRHFNRAVLIAVPRAGREAEASGSSEGGAE